LPEAPTPEFLNNLLSFTCSKICFPSSFPRDTGPKTTHICSHQHGGVSWAKWGLELAAAISPTLSLTEPPSSSGPCWHPV
jgi:hypothetical protein